MTPEHLKEIKDLAEDRLRVGDLLASHLLLVILEFQKAQADLQIAKDEIRKLDAFLNPKPEAP